MRSAASAVGCNISSAEFFEVSGSQAWPPIYIPLIIPGLDVHRIITYALLPSHENERNHILPTVIAQSPDYKTKPNNTSVNERDQNSR
jgi:hypothetical protein